MEPRETDSIVSQEVKDINKKEKSKGTKYWEIPAGLCRIATPAGTPLFLQPSCSMHEMADIYWKSKLKSYPVVTLNSHPG